MYHVVSTKIDHNQVNDVVDNELGFYSNNSFANNHVKDTLTIVAISLRGGNKSRQNLS